MKRMKRWLGIVLSIIVGTIDGLLYAYTVRNKFMKKNVIAIVLILVIAVGNLAGSNAMAAEITAEEAALDREETDAFADADSATVKAEDISAIAEEEQEPDHADTAGGESAGEAISQPDEQTAVGTTEAAVGTTEAAAGTTEADIAATEANIETAEETAGTTEASIETAEAAAGTTETAAEENEEDASAEMTAEAAEKIEERNDAKSSDTAVSGNFGADGDNVTYLFDNGVLTLSGSGAMAEEKYYNIPWRSYKKQITKIVIGEGITSIGAWAFNGTMITSVTLPSTVKVLGESAFAYCTELKTVYLNDGLVSIGENAFEEDTLNTLRIPESVENIDFTAFSSVSINDLILENSSYQIIDGVVFRNKGKEIVYVSSDLTGSYVVPDGVEIIGDSAFRSTKLTSVLLPSGLREIGRKAFSYAAITSVLFPSSVKTIGDNAFEGTPIKSVVIPDNVEQVGECVFMDCTSLVEAEIRCGLDKVGRFLFSRCYALQTAIVNEDETTIPAGAFQVCYALENFEMPSTVENIGEYAFKYCGKIDSVDLPAVLKTIGESAFDETGITSVTIPSSVTSIGAKAFPAGCEVNLPPTLVKIDDGNYYSTTEMSNVGLSVTYGQTEARRMLSMINEFRRPENAWYYDQSGSKVYRTDLEPFRYDYDLEKIAMQRAAECAVYIDSNHVRPDGTICFSASSNGVRAYGENVAWGASDAETAFWVWQETDSHYNGQGHRRNMLSEGYTSIGIGHVIHNGCHYWVQEFGNDETAVTGETKAVDGGQTVSIFIRNTRFGDKAFSLLPSSYMLDADEEASVPTVSLSDDLTALGFSMLNTTAMDPEWESTDTDIVKIQNGKLVGISEGTAYITANVLGRIRKVPVFVGKLGASTKVTLTNVASGIKITWNKVEGAKYYKIYRGNQLILTTSRVYATDTAVKYNNGTKYTYKVFASYTNTGTDGDSPKYRTATGYRLMPVGIKKLTNPSAGKMAVTYDKSAGSSGYVIRFGLKSDLSDAKVITVKGENTLSRTFSGMKKGKTYYVQARTYKLDHGIRYYSGYCTTKTITIRK